ncbi:MAG: NUDIX domain-containing protein [Chloroflexi bacterium]|nr:NUDIX domain-containing protein [Chloroflexota bacterium]
MPTESASAIVFSPDRKQVLLIKREDFRIWVLPGGGIEPGETHEQAAIRETREETGYEIAIDRLVGRYWHPQSPRGGDRRFLFEGHIIGGAAIQNGPETRGVEFFPVNALPARTIPWLKEFVADALANSNVIERTQRLPLWMFVTLRVGIILRDLRNRYLRKNESH